ncbi:nucleoside hydrolase [Poriferisphaera sp. WC338]|uniref:nucleoside hydrolase n=1 Tax=Poriferisphaera sp. WC338 TaxID=3425129 RepID=UPI003D81B862
MDSFLNKPNQPVKIILDTDMGNDIDDALALALIHTLQDHGECELLSVISSKDHPNAATCIDLLNTFYGRPSIPIGQITSGFTPEVGLFNKALTDKQNDQGKPLYPCSQSPEQYTDPVTLLRKQLAEHDDHSVIIMMIGFSTNIIRLFESPPDQYSPLSGHDLVDQKVSYFSVMAGNFCEENVHSPDLKYREYNIHMDPESARRFANESPRPIIYSGFEIGLAIPYPMASIESDYNWIDHHPVIDGYRLYREMPHNRPTWDLTSALFSIRPHEGYFQLSQPGNVDIREDHVTVFTPDPNGNCVYLKLDPNQIPRITQTFTELCSAIPRNHPAAKQQTPTT